MKSERWLAAPGYEGLYEVSDQGRVKSLARTITGGYGATLLAPERILKQAVSGDYLRVTLYLSGVPRQFLAQRLVLLTFVGLCAANMEACHRNGRPQDNCLSNLRWGTSKENSADARRHGTVERGESRARAKLTEDAVREIRVLRDGGATQSGLAAKFDVSRTAIRQVLDGRSWAHVT